MALTGSVRLVLGLNETKVADLGAASLPLNADYLWKITSGVGLDQADLLFSDQRSIAQSANEDLDLAGIIAGIYGATITMVKLKALIIKAALLNPGNLTIGRGATNGVPWVSAVSAGVIVPPGGFFGWAAPSLAAVAVTAGTGDLINVASAATVGTYTYDVVLIGTSA